MCVWFLKVGVLLIAFVVALSLNCVRIQAQTYNSDQQTPSRAEGGLALDLISLQQSFVPRLSSVGFVRLDLQDKTPGDGQGAKIAVKLRQDTYDGELMGTTPSITVPDGFHGVLTFTFPTNILVDPGYTYFFEPIWQGGDGVFIAGANQLTNAFQVINGRPNSNDVFFVEGIVQSQLHQPKVTNGVVTINWDGGGVLQISDNLGGPWKDMRRLTNSFYSIPATNSMQIFRVRR